MCMNVSVYVTFNYNWCRLEILGAGCIHQLLGGAAAFSGLVHVCMWCALDSISVILF